MKKTSFANISTFYYFVWIQSGIAGGPGILLHTTVNTKIYWTTDTANLFTPGSVHWIHALLFPAAGAKSHLPTTKTAKHRSQVSWQKPFDLMTLQSSMKLPSLGPLPDASHLSQLLDVDVFNKYDFFSRLNSLFTADTDLLFVHLNCLLISSFQPLQKVWIKLWRPCWLLKFSYKIFTNQGQ